MSEYVFAIEYARAPRLMNGSGAPRELVVPVEMLKVEPGELCGRVLYVVVKQETSNYLALKTRVDAVQQACEDSPSHEYLLLLNPNCSVATIGRATEARRWIIKSDVSDVAALERCTMEMTRECERLMTTWAVLAAAPRQDPTAPVWRANESVERLRVILRTALRERSLSDLASHRALAPLSPYGAHVYKSVSTISPADDAALRGLLEDIDPLMTRADTPLVGVHVPAIDTQLEEIHEDEVVARKFIAGDPSRDPAAQAAAVDRAESLHQRAVRGLLRGLRMLEIIPLASRSVDIAYWHREVPRLIEVKSANANNLVGQVMTGIIQVLAYEVEMESVTQHRYQSAVLVAHEEPLNLPIECVRLAERAGVSIVAVRLEPETEPVLVEAARALLAVTLPESRPLPPSAS